MPRSRKFGFIHPFPHTPSWHSVKLVKHRDNFTFLPIHLCHVQSKIFWDLHCAHSELRLKSLQCSGTIVFGVSQVGLYQVLERAVFVFSTVIPWDVCRMHSVLFRIHAVFSLCCVLDLGEFRSVNVLGSWCCLQEPQANYQLSDAQTHTRTVWFLLLMYHRHKLLDLIDHK
jgi:hypothetical protein